MKGFAHFNFLSFKIYNKGNGSLVNNFLELKIHIMAKATQISGNSLFFKKNGTFVFEKI